MELSEVRGDHHWWRDGFPDPVSFSDVYRLVVEEKVSVADFSLGEVDLGVFLKYHRRRLAAWTEDHYFGLSAIQMGDLIRVALCQENSILRRANLRVFSPIYT